MLLSQKPMLCHTLKKKTCIGRKSLSPSVGDNHRLCVKFVSQENQVDHTTVTKNNEKSSLSFCVMNTQSLNNKAGEFADFVCKYKPDVVAIMETWFLHSLYVSRVQPS